ncbi:protein BNIP5 [Prionailurus bengalensis]|uniref:protein BNIP5 n=1 Tax=Prionailurus bengalensis TaxID=37029 RepID=UPI001CA7D791|nr:protein BNIP5 [Prionailurus bengalensis]
MEPRKHLSGRRARSLDRSQSPKKVRRCFSLPTTPSRRMLHQAASNGSRCPQSPAQSVEAQDATATAPSLEETREFLPTDQRLPQDTKKEKTQRRGQQGWLKTLMNFLLRTGPEEPKEKASRKAKGKEGLPKPAETPEAPGETAPRKKAHDKKASRKKHSHKKHVAEETKGAQDQEAEGQEIGLPKMSAAPRPEEADLGPAPKGGKGSGLHQSLLIEAGGPAASEVSSQATGHRPEEELRKLDQDKIIKMIVEFLQKVGDQWEEELFLREPSPLLKVKGPTQRFLSFLPQQLQAPQPEVVVQIPVSFDRKKFQEKKSSFKRAFSHKKHGSEEAKRAGPADVSSPESRPPKRPSFLPLCVGGHQPSTSSSPGSEEPKVQEVLPTDSGGLSPLELSTPAGSQGPEEDLQANRALEFREFIQKIIALLQDAEEQGGEFFSSPPQQLRVQEPEVAVENLSPAYRRRSQEKKSSLRKAFSYKRHGPKEPRRAGAAGAASPESRPPKRPSFLPLCVGGHQPSTSNSPDLEDVEFQESSPAEETPVGSSDAPSQTRSHQPEAGPQPDGVFESKELVIQNLVALLQEVDGQLGEQIRRHPSFKRFFYKVSDSSLRKLAATLHSQKARPPELGRNLTKTPYQLAFGFTNKFASNNSHAVFSLMGLCYSHAGYTHFPYREAQQVRKSQTAQAKTSPRSQQDPLTVPSPPLLSSTLNITNPESQSPD